MKRIIDVITEAIVKKPRTTEYKANNTITVYDWHGQQYIILFTKNELKKLIKETKQNINFSSLDNNNIKNTFNANAAIGIRPTRAGRITYKTFITKNTDLTAPAIKRKQAYWAYVENLTILKTYDMAWFNTDNWHKAGYTFSIYIN